MSYVMSTSKDARIRARLSVLCTLAMRSINYFNIAHDLMFMYFKYKTQKYLALADSHYSFTVE